MKQILILFAHPRFEKSKTNKALLNSVRQFNYVTIHDLYEEYPNFHIDISREQELLQNHDVVVWHHPLYWYSSPAILKHWIDLVLEYDWAYGKNGNALLGKRCLQVITAGAASDVYSATGKHAHTVNEFLLPFKQTAQLCKMNYLPPYEIMGTFNFDEKALQRHVNHYQKLMRYLTENRNIEILQFQLKNGVWNSDKSENEIDW